MKKLFLTLAAALCTSPMWADVPTLPSKVSVQGTQLIVQKRLANGTLSQPIAYTIKGVDWSPATRAPDTGPLPPGSPAGASNQYGFFFDWAGRNPEGHVLMNYWTNNEQQAHYLQDIPLMAQMHINTVRIYGDFGDDPAVYKAILDTFYNNNIMVIFTVPASQADLLSGRYLQVMSYCQNHPAVLMWSIGNEWNFNLMYGFSNVAAAESAINGIVPGMKAQDPNHPVASSLGDAGSTSAYASIVNLVPNVDLWSLNIYRGQSFNTLFSQWTFATSKPFFLGEFGVDSFNSTAYTLPGSGEAHVTAGAEDQATQSTWDLSLWGEIKTNLSSVDNSKTCIGGLVFSWNDELWKVGNFNVGLGNLPTSNYTNDTDYNTQEPDGFYIPGGFPDNVDNEEYFGIVTADRAPKKTYTDLQSYYVALAPLPLTSLVISPTGGALHYNQTISFSAQGLNAFEEPLNPQPVITWTITPSTGASISSGGLFTSFVTSGTFWVNAASGIISSSVAVVVTNAPPTVATPASSVPAAVSGAAATLSVLGDDDAGEAQLSYRWSATGPAAALFNGTQGVNASKTMQVSFSSAGLYGFTVTLQDQDGATTTSTLPLTVNSTLSAVTIHPSTQTVAALSTQAFTLDEQDQFGHALALPGAGIWTATGGTIDSSGLFTAGAVPGNFTITFTNGALTATAAVRVDAQGSVATLPPPTFGFPSEVSVDGELSVSLPAGFVTDHFDWTFTPQSAGTLTNASAFFGYHAAPAGSLAFSTTQGVLNLGPLNIPTGRYVLTVQAFGANGAFSPPVQGAITLVADSFGALRVYPSPWRSDQHANHPITFDGLTANATVKIFTLSAHWVQTLGPVNGSVTWDLKNSAGDNVASGLYFYVITNDQGQTSRGKFAIIR